MRGSHKDQQGRPSRGLFRVVASWLTTVLLLGVLAGVGVAAWAVRSGDWQAHPVLSGSMEPRLPTGSIAIMHATPTSELRVGDVITFAEPGNSAHLITHRIASITQKDGRRVYETKGDANRINDPWKVTLRGDMSYRLYNDVPYVGYPVAWLRQPDTRTWLYGAAGLIALWAVYQLFLPDRPSKRRQDRSTCASPADELTQTEVHP